MSVFLGVLHHIWFLLYFFLNKKTMFVLVRKDRDKINQMLHQSNIFVVVLNNVIYEDQWHSHLMLSLWQLSCHYLFLSRLGIEQLTFRLRGERSNPLCHHDGLYTYKGCWVYITKWCWIVQRKHSLREPNYSSPSRYLSYFKKFSFGVFCLPNTFIYSTLLVTKACPADRVIQWSIPCPEERRRGKMSRRRAAWHFWPAFVLVYITN